MSRPAAASKKKPISAATKRSTTPNSVDSHEDIEIRTIKKPEYRSFRLSKPIKHPKPRIAGSLAILSRSVRFLWRHKKIFLAIYITHILLMLIFVRGMSGSSVSVDLRDLTDQLINADIGKLTTGLTIVGLLMGSGGGNNEVAATLQVIIVTITSLAVIWVMRQVSSGARVRMRDGYYQGMYPLIPFILVFLVVCMQLIPIMFANFLFGLLYVGGVASTLVEQFLWLLLLFMFVVWSLYMISSSIIALYIVTLPNRGPLWSLRAARGVVRYRRWTVMRRIISFPILMTISIFMIMAPLVYFWPGGAEFMFFLITSSALFFVHSYYYNLYRELIK